MDDYDSLPKSRFKFKGDKKKKKPKLKKEEGDAESSKANCSKDERAEDALDHGGWWKVDRYEHIQGDVAIEFLPGCYAKSLSNGSIVLGNPHPPGEAPDEEEIFTSVCAGTNQIAFKSGFDRYLAIDSRKHLVGLSEAIGEQETFLPVFEDGKLALSAYNECFLSPDDESEKQQIVARAEKAGPYEMLRIRVEHDPLKFDGKRADKGNPSEDLGTIYATEIGHLKKLKKGHDIDVNEHKRHLKKARVEGELHEALLDKRVKLKSDKYCK